MDRYILRPFFRCFVETVEIHTKSSKPSRNTSSIYTLIFLREGPGRATCQVGSSIQTPSSHLTLSLFLVHSRPLEHYVTYQQCTCRILQTNTHTHTYIFFAIRSFIIHFGNQLSSTRHSQTITHLLKYLRNQQARVKRGLDRAISRDYRLSSGWLIVL